MNSTETRTWGEFKPTGNAAWLRLLVKAGLSCGFLHKWVTRTWIKRLGRGPVDITYYGLKLRVIPDKNMTDHKLLLRSGHRDQAELSFISRHVPAKEVFLDIGANIGYYSLSAASLGFARVVAIEPNPRLVPRLQFNASVNGLDERFRLVPCAVSDHEGEMFLHSPGDMGSGTVSTTASDGSVSVNVNTLANILTESGVDQVSAFKIDVEGHEDKALLPWLKSLPDEKLPVAGILEFVHQHRWHEDVIAYLLGRGYRIAMKTRSNVIVVRNMIPGGALLNQATLSA
ncbi:MAG TPA: FkbM family methyltransferase [Rariglobus sp.]|jgi:FkbM family methyltransferase|nr:FkbM family methyltransferase [Rariglobus sp.]